MFLNLRGGSNSCPSSDALFYVSSVYIVWEPCVTEIPEYPEFSKLYC